MGRGGAGRGGGHFSGGHRSSHSVSGHRSGSGMSRGSGSRGGISSSPSHKGSSGNFVRGPSIPPPRPPRSSMHIHNHYGSYGYHGNTYRSSPSTFIVALTFLVICVILIIIVNTAGRVLSGSNYSVTTHQGLGKEKIQPVAEFMTDCVVDEDNWFADPYQVGRDLKSFYDLTGIQPYVYIKAPDSSLSSDSAKEAYADEWYYDNIDHEGALLYVYFAETDPDIAGYAVLIGGSATKAFFDSNATNAFWDIYDSYYFNTSITEEQLIVNTFNDTATICLSDKTITNTQATGVFAGIKKIMPIVALIFTVATVVIVVVNIVKFRRRIEAEKAAETERILNTPLEELEKDALLDKYSNK